MKSKRSKLFGVCGIGTAFGQAPPIRIGEINSYTGPVAVFTHPYRNGLQMAASRASPARPLMQAVVAATTATTGWPT